MERLVLGVDMSKASFTAALWLDEQASDLGVLPNDAAGFRQLHEQVSAYQRQQAPAGMPLRIQLIVEPTGGYELAFTQRVPAARSRAQFAGGDRCLGKGTGRTRSGQQEPNKQQYH
jgi:hypothetical protein